VASIHEDFYLEQVRKGTQNDATIAERFRKKFPKGDVSKTRQSLLNKGLIVVIRREQRNGRSYAYYDIPRELKEQSTHWEDGTKKSTGNAFDWRSFAKGIMTQQNTLVPVAAPHRITVYSRA
jgi:hypothetical protein